MGTADGTSRRLVGVAVVGAGWIAAHALGLLGPLSPLTFVLLSLTTITATIVGVRRHRPVLSWPWWSIAAATFLWLVGGAAREALGTVGDLTAHRSLVPDAITLSGYALFGLGLVGFVRARQRNRARDVDALLDGVVAALAAFTLAWVFLINPAVFEAGAPLGVRLTLACYPPMSVFLVAVTARLAFCSGRQATTSQRLLLTAMVSMLVGDVVYMFVDARLIDLSRHLLDVPYALAYLLFALNALHPSMRELCEPLPRDEGTPGRGRLTLVAVALGIPAVVTSVRAADTPEDRLVLAATILTLTGAAIWRVTRALGAHARAESRFAYQATHDSLTGLPNRLFLLEHLARHLRELGAGSPPVALLFLDVDRFKLVNDTGGHSLGDDLLVGVARRLQRNVSAGDLVARIGGDEFVVLLPAVADRAAALAVAERLRASFRAPFSIRGADVYASASIGVSVADGSTTGLGAGLTGFGGGIDAEAMIRDADTAMYQAKEAGRDGVAAFDASMRDRASRRLQLEHHLRNALANRELHVLLQPIIRLDRGCVDGFEALLRWRHRTLGEVPPAEFIPIAEDTGLINEIGAWTIDEACRSLRRCRQSLPAAPDLTVAVNLSARQLRDPTLLPTVQQALERHDLPAGALCLELTESMLMDDPAAAAETLRALRGRGVLLSIDDFGTGYSSLSYLKRFPVDNVKIDRSFIDGLESPGGSESSLVSAIIALARALDMTTVAEGVETDGQLRRLQQLGCDRVQGYRFSRPVPVEEVLGVVARLMPAAAATHAAHLIADRSADFVADLAADLVGHGAS